MLVKIKSIRFFIFILSSLLILSSRLASQTAATPLAFNALTINDGLSQGMVLCMLQDRYGFMWFATLDGLNRYDGYKFVVYRHDAKDPNSITESFVKTLYEDSEGRLWIGSIAGGLDLFDRESDSFIHFKHLEGNPNSLSPGSVNSIIEDKQRNIWVNVSGKIDKIIIPKLKKPSASNISIHHLKPPSNSEISFLSRTKSGRIYYTDGQNGLTYKLDDEKTNSWSVFFRVNMQSPRFSYSGGVLYNIAQLLEDKMHGKFYIFHEGGVTRFDERTGAKETFFPNPNFRNFDTPLRAVIDNAGFVWYSGVNTLSLFNTKNGEIKDARALDDNLERQVSSAYSTFIDRSGLLWIGTAGYGILKRNTRAELFHHTGSSSNYAIHEGDNGEILLGNGLVVREVFDRQSARLIGAKGPNTNFNKFLFRPIVVSNQGDWFADKQRLRHVDNRLNKTTYYYLPVAGNNEYELIQSSLADSAGFIWLATTEGLLRFNITDTRWSVFKNNPTKLSTISSNVVFSLCLDPLQPKKYMWVGTSGGGLNRMDLASGEFKSYSYKHGLPNDVIYGILSDDDGNLWMSTNKGLSCFNPRKETFRNFDHKDGLQSNEFNRGAYYRSKEGILYFGGVNGINYFNPKEILNNKTVPQIVITGLKTRNQLVSAQPDSSLLLQSIYKLNNLKLPYEQNFVSIEFASLDYTDPGKNMYKYQLKGFDKDFILSGTTNNATYTNLDPGTYTFTVKGSNNDGTWNETGTSIQLTILPPWYMTWWFRVILVLAFLSAVYSIYRYRLQQALNLQAIRDRIANDLHDEVGSNLSNIYIFSNVAQQKIKANDETAPILQKITDYTQQSMEAMNDIVWMINTRNDRFENIMVRMRTLAAEFTETSDCELQLNFDESLNDVKLNMEERKNFYLIYKEAINNLSKYAGCKNVWIDMKLHQDTVTLMIRDNGKGFDVTKNNAGNGLYNMKKRAEFLHGTFNINSKIGEGTTLQLSFKV